MSYYQDVKDPNIPIEEVKTRLEKACENLDVNLPETIIYEESWGSFKAPRLRDNGRTIILYKTQNDSILNWQLGVLIQPYLTKNSLRWIVRHYDAVLFIPTTFMLIINMFALLYLRSGVFDTSIAYTLLFLQFPFAGVSWFMKGVAKDKVIILKDAMNQIGPWPEDNISNYEKAYVRISFAMVIGFILFALMFGVEIIFR